jgi:FMN phosphatase YigB (HAD superfamily)
MSIALIDVDSTLLPFYKNLYKKLLKINPKLKPPIYWDKWDFYKDYGISYKQFYKVVDLLHSNIKEEPFLFAKELVELLIFTGYKIFICSHREMKEDLLKELVSWLDKYKIQYNSVILTNKKWDLFKKYDISLVIDDSPKVLAKAEEFGINYTGIKFPWNKEFHDKLGKNLGEIYLKILIGEV